MSYSINVTGQRDTALEAMRSAVASQRVNLVGAQEQDYLDKAASDMTDMVNQYAGESDTVAISLSGHVSQSDTSLAIGKSCGLSITKAPPAPAADPNATTGVPALEQARSIAAGTASAPTAAGAPVTSTPPTSGPQSVTPAPATSTGSTTGR